MLKYLHTEVLIICWSISTRISSRITWSISTRITEVSPHCTTLPYHKNQFQQSKFAHAGLGAQRSGSWLRNCTCMVLRYNGRGNKTTYFATTTVTRPEKRQVSHTVISKVHRFPPCYSNGVMRALLRSVWVIWHIYWKWVGPAPKSRSLGG